MYIEVSMIDGGLGVGVAQRLNNPAEFPLGDAPPRHVP